MKYLRRADGTEAVADDMPPTVRAVALLLEHANERRDAGLPLPCLCRGCEGHRAAVRCTASPDGFTVIVEAVRP